MHLQSLLSCEAPSPLPGQRTHLAHLTGPLKCNCCCLLFQEVPFSLQLYGSPMALYSVKINNVNTKSTLELAAYLTRAMSHGSSQ